MSAASSTAGARTRNLLIAVAIAAPSAGIVSAGIASTAVALGVPPIPQLTPIAVALFAFLGAAIGAVGWELICRRAAQPRRVLARLVPILLLVSFVPDVVLGVLIAPSTGVSPVLALAAMHVTTVAIALPVYVRLLRVPTGVAPSIARADGAQANVA